MRKRNQVEIRLDPPQMLLLVLGTTFFSGLLFAAGFQLGRTRRPDLVLRPPLPPISQKLVQVQEERPPLPLGEVEFLFPSPYRSPPAHPSVKGR